MGNKSYGIFLTERSMLRFLVYLILGRKICVLGTYSYVQNHGGFLQKLVSRLHARKVIEVVADRASQFPYKDNGDFQRLTNIFSEAEPWMENEFEMPSMEGSYALACKHIISNRTYALYQRNFDRFYLSGSLVLPPSDTIDRSFYLYRFGIRLKQHWLEPVEKMLYNVFFLVVSLLHCFVWILTHIRFKVQQHSIRLATDYNGGPRDMKFWDYLSPDRAKTLVVVRDKYTMKAFGHSSKDTRLSLTTMAR
jgi:hypothetical protein